MSAPKRTRLRAVYLTDTERDLLVSGMRYLRTQLTPGTMHSAENFAKSFTARRIDDVLAVLAAVDKTEVGAA